MSNYDAIDITYSWNGDFAPGTDGDLSDTSNDQIQSLIQEVQTIVNSSLGDWQEHPNYAASLDDYVGEPNNRETARQITDRVRTSLINNNIVSADDLSVSVIPVERSKVLIIIAINAASTPNNSIIQGELAKVTFIYDYSERGIFYLEG